MCIRDRLIGQLNNSFKSVIDRSDIRDDVTDTKYAPDSSFELASELSTIRTR